MHTRSKNNTMSIDQKLDLLLSDIADIKSSNKQFKEDISSIKEDLKEFKADISNSLDMCFGKISDIDTNLKNCQQKVSDCENTISNLTSENSSLKKEIQELKKSVRASDQYSRSNCLELWGVPESRNENILNVVQNVSRVLGFDFKDSMVDAAHRLSKNTNKPHVPRGIIVKFCRRIDMEALRARSRVKNGISAIDLGYNSDSKVYINMSLSKDTRELWAHTRTTKEAKNYKYAWITSSGKIFVRKAEGANAVLIAEKSDLDRLK